MKKIWIFVAIIIALFALSCTAEAEIVSSGYCGDNVQYTLDNTGLLTIAGTGEMTSIWWYFDGLSDQIKNVIIENGVSNIDYMAFYRCSNLESISIPNSVTHIEDWAFTDCNKLTSIVIPNSVSTIGEWAFAGCSNLSSVNMPSQMKSIGNYAFSGCGGLKSIRIPDGITDIGQDTFKNCSSLESLDIPHGVISIGDYAFDGCKSLNSLNISSGVTEIGSHAFNECNNLASLTIPEGVISIGDYALSVWNMNSITLPSSIQNIGKGIFKGAKRDFVIYCKPNSYVEKYAKSHGLQYDNGVERVVGYNISNLEEKANWIISHYISSGMSEREKARVLHDWIVYNAHYDYNSSGIASDILLNGGGICSAYTDAYSYLLNKVGIMNRSLNGTPEMNHTWNLVRINGQWYHVDVTWDDPGTGDQIEVISGWEHYQNFLVNDSTIGKNHFWDEDVSADINKVGKVDFQGKQYNFPGEERIIKNGLCLVDGVWRYYENDTFVEKTGIVEFEGGQFFVANGLLCSDANGLNEYGGQWYFLANGQIQTQYTGLALYDGAWFYLRNGLLDTGLSGLVDYDGSKFIVAAGQLIRGVNGLWQNTDGTWYFLADSQVVTYFRGMAEYDGHWFYIVEGRLMTEYTGNVVDGDREFYVVNGQAVQ